MSDFLTLAFVFLISGVIAVPIASRIGLGSVPGYLMAGIAISPILAGLHVDVTSIQHFAEFGVVMMLFLVGLELDPKILWSMRHRLIGLGGLQVGLTTVLIMAAAMILGESWTVALACGLIFSLSSTAIVLQTMNEKGLSRTDGGQASFSVLLFQDIAVIPILAILPLLAIPGLGEVVGQSISGGVEIQGKPSDHSGGVSLVATLSGWQTALITIMAVAGVIVGGIYLTRPIFHYAAMANLREVFVATALLIVIGIALLMMLVGLSPALGTFLAGVVLANSEFRHELESDIDPFRGLLLGLFFMTVGASINFEMLFNNFGVVIGLTIGLMSVKFIVLMVSAYFFKLQKSNGWLFGLGLAQAGEFGFALLSFSVGNGVLSKSMADQLLLVVALSMLLTPLLYVFYLWIVQPYFSSTTEQASENLEEKNKIIIAGHGRFGGVVNRMLLENGFKATVLDCSSNQLKMLRSFGVRVFFGDATRPDLLQAAGIAEAKLLVVAIDQRSAATNLVRLVRRKYSGVSIVARAVDRHHVYELYSAGADHIIRDTFDSAVRAGRLAWEVLGVEKKQAERMAHEFTVGDSATLADLAEYYDPKIPPHKNSVYRERVRNLMGKHYDQLPDR